jgi:cytochrome c peroxidase
MRQKVARRCRCTFDAAPGVWQRRDVVRPRNHRSRWLAGLGVSLLLTCVWVSGAAAHGATPPPLVGLQVPEVPGLLRGRGRVVRNRAKAVALGKALFWDAQVGSDGMACASCHYHAGTDARLKNQLAPGHLPASRPTAGTFEPMASGAAGGPNYTLRRSDFPLHQLADVLSLSSDVLFTTDDVVGSGGSFGGTYHGASDETSAFDDCDRSGDATFNVHGIGTRRVTSRNAPSVINAVFSSRNFWDGRANNVFNGENPFGDRDPDAGVWLWRKGRAERVRVGLVNSSLASQAVAPPLDTTEMSCSGRTFADIGRKLLGRRALQLQEVHAADGVLGRYRDRSGNGLKWTYSKLVRKAFHRRYWRAKAKKTRGAFGAPAAGGEPYTQMEANFAMFFGIAIQLYESTLVSDQTPFDSPRDAQGFPEALNEQERRGLVEFTNLHCSQCHLGPTLSGDAAAVPDTAVAEVDRKLIRASSGGTVLGLVDAGYINTGVVPLSEDPGVGGDDPFGHPLSLTAQYLDVLLGHPENVLDPMRVQSCVMTTPFVLGAFGIPPFDPAELMDDPAGTERCSAPLWALVPTPAVVAAELGQPEQGRLRSGTVGAFKAPSLRNVELTGPYMHNGSMATLEEVLDFYNRGGNFSTPGKDAEFLFGAGAAPDTLADLLAFLKTLTDDRVRWEQAPFDHPALVIPAGHTGDHTAVDPDGATDLGRQEFIVLPAVGASGRDETLGPLRPLAERLQP